MKNTLTLLTLISLLTKVALHMHLDWKHKKFKFFPTGFAPITYFFFYLDDVNKKFENEKRICNFFYIILIISIVLTFIAR